MNLNERKKLLKCMTTKLSTSGCEELMRHQTYTTFILHLPMRISYNRCCSAHTDTDLTSQKIVHLEKTLWMVHFSIVSRHGWLAYWLFCMYGDDIFAGLRREFLFKMFARYHSTFNLCIFNSKLHLKTVSPSK